MAALTSAGAAAFLGVSPSTVKRWADAGLLKAARTGGRHRRFSTASLARFAAEHADLTAAASDDEDGGLVELRSASWVELLLRDADQHALDARLLADRAYLGSWWRVCETLGAVLTAIGRRWCDGEISILEEHAASERLARSLARACEWMPLGPDAPCALLATPEGEEHTLGLSLVELTLREAGVAARWAGRATPSSELERLVSQPGAVSLLALSATRTVRAAALARQLKRVAHSCRLGRTPLVVGGHGAWPARLGWGVRLRDFHVLHEYARALRSDVTTEHAHAR